jgi:hypothetical protein
MSRLKTFRVRFCVRDFYIIELKARDAEDAEEQAMDLYNRHGEEPFEFDISDGGTDGWDVEEVLS